MATMINQLITWYTYLNDDVAGLQYVLLITMFAIGFNDFIFFTLQDPRTKYLPFVGTPWSILALLGFYLYFVLSLGPKFMAKRQPFKLNRILQIYNILQIMISLFIFTEAAKIWFTEYNFTCQPVDYSNSPSAIRMIQYFWLYLMNKLFDLLDTVFFVLKKKNGQMTFLHIYHHFGVVIAAWVGMKFYPGGHSTFIGLANTFVHAIMYLYYLLSSMKINLSYWKKYVTQMQIIQFFIIMVHQAQLILWVDCDYPKWVSLLLVTQNIFFIILFSDFYHKTYIKPTRKAVPTQSETNGITNDMNRKPKGQ